MLIFEFMNLRCEAVGGLSFFKSDLCLEDDCSAVVTFIHIMNCDARNFFFSSDDCFVNVFAVKSFAALFWQQGRMNVDDFIWESIDEMLWKKP